MSFIAPRSSRPETLTHVCAVGCRGEVRIDADCSADRPGDDCGLPLWPGGRRLSCERRAIESWRLL
eukprot:15478203-Alexandrium_andersonii.AAC.1